MASLNLFLNNQYIYYQSQDLDIEDTFLDFGELNTDPLEKLNELLTELDLPRNVSLNLTLDQLFINYYVFTLPPVGKRKIDKILEFELGDTLLSDIEEYFYDYRFDIEKEQSTRLGVYLIKKELVHRIVQIGKSNHIDIRSIIPLNDLLDIKFKESFKPTNEIVLTAEQNYSKLFVYKNGFLVGCSSVPLQFKNQLDLENPVGDQNTESLPINQINQKIRSILIKEVDLESVMIEGGIDSVLHVNEQMEIDYVNGEIVEFPKSICPDVIQQSYITRTNRINLVKANLAIIQEIKKHAKQFIITSVFALCCFGLYIGSLVYQNSINNERYLQLDQEYTKAIGKYLPKGTSKSNAINILRNQVAELKELKEKNEKFSRRSYTVTNQLNQLSGLKQTVTSLKINRYFMTDQSIRIQGEVSSFADYDQLKNSLGRIFPKEEYSIKYNQKSVGNDIVQFSVTIRSER